MCVLGVWVPSIINNLDLILYFMYHLRGKKKTERFTRTGALFIQSSSSSLQNTRGEKDCVCVTRSRFGFHLVFFSLLHVPPALDCVVTVFFTYMYFIFCI